MLLHTEAVELGEQALNDLGESGCQGHWEEKKNSSSSFSSHTCHFNPCTYIVRTVLCNGFFSPSALFNFLVLVPKTKRKGLAKLLLTCSGVADAPDGPGGERRPGGGSRRSRRPWLLPQEEADVEAEAGQEADVQQYDHQQVPPTGPPVVAH